MPKIDVTIFGSTTAQPAAGPSKPSDMTAAEFEGDGAHRCYLALHRPCAARQNLYEHFLRCGDVSPFIRESARPGNVAEVTDEDKGRRKKVRSRK